VIAVITISVEDFLWFVDEALDGMVAIVEELGDERAAVPPDLPGANSAYALLTHCLGVMEQWGGHHIAGRPIDRDRDAEFVAQGSVADLVARTRRARAQLAVDLGTLEPARPLRQPPDDEDIELALGRTQGGAAVHLYEELAQHRGQMELGRDVVLARAGRVSRQDG
jgi:hypothetical protein